MGGKGKTQCHENSKRFHKELMQLFNNILMTLETDIAWFLVNIDICWTFNVITHVNHSFSSSIRFLYVLFLMYLFLLMVFVNLYQKGKRGKH